MNYFTLLFVFTLNILPVFSLSNDCQNVQNFFDNYKLQTGSTILIPNCCEKTDQYHYIDCDNEGNITDLQLRFNKQVEQIDFTNFPVLNNIENILLEGPMFNNYIFPIHFFNLPKLKSLEIINSNIREVPDVETSCSLTKLSVHKNSIQGFPKAFLNCKKLEYLNLSVNKDIKDIPDEISTLKDLKYLFIGVAGLTRINPKITELKNLVELEISGNTELTTEINFKNTI